MKAPRNNDESLNLLPENYDKLDFVAMGASPLSACEKGPYASNCSPGDNYNKCIDGGSGTCA